MHFLTSSYTEIRKKARNLECDIDLKLVALSKLSSGHGSSESSPLISSEFSYDTISLEINDMLAKLGELNEKMSQMPLNGTAQVNFEI